MEVIFIKIIGVITGVYEGNNYAKVILTEPVTKTASVGLNAIVSKCNYLLALHLIEDWELYNDQDVEVNYDRFGKIQTLHLIGG